MTCVTSVSILIFLGLSVLDLVPMYATDRRQTRIIAYLRSRSIITRRQQTSNKAAYNLLSIVVIIYGVGYQILTIALSCSSKNSVKIHGSGT